MCLPLVGDIDKCQHMWVRGGTTLTPQHSQWCTRKRLPADTHTHLAVTHTHTLLSHIFCRYFANLIEQRLGPDDNVIIITHEPTWLLEWFWASSSSSNLRQLVRGHLRGRARVHLAGERGGRHA